MIRLSKHVEKTQLEGDNIHRYRHVLDRRGKPIIINMGDVTKIEYKKNRWRFITPYGDFRDPSNALEYAILFSHVPFFKANQKTLLNMNKVNYVLARKAHTDMGLVTVTRPNYAKLRNFFKNST